MNHLCDQKITCTGSDNPILNLSSEDPDREVFIGYSWGWHFPPPIGSRWQADGCDSLCLSTISQAAADSCAAAQWLSCFVQGNNPGSVTPVGGNPIEPAVNVFSSQPQTAAISCPDGTIFYYTTVAGLFTAPTQEQANQQALSYANYQVYRARVCLSTLSGRMCKGQASAVAITASTRSASVSFTIVSGSLPPGITGAQVAAKTYVFAGTPTVAGNYTILVRADDGTGNFMQKAYTLAVLGISNADPLPAATAGVAYSEQLNAAGGTAPYTFTLENGSLPDGLTLSASGLISGTPTTDGTSDFNIRVTDSA